MVYGENNDLHLTSQSALAFAKIAQNCTLPLMTLRQLSFDATLHLRQRQEYLYGGPDLNISGTPHNTKPEKDHD
jgi:hypothetical protein